MKKILILLFLIVGCNHTAPTTENDAAAESQREQPATVTPEPEAQNNQLASEGLLKMIRAPAKNAKLEDGTTALLMLDALQFVADTGQTPKGFFFRGVMENGLFIPDDKGLQGSASSPVGGTPGWVELHTGKFLPAMTARAPAKPFIEGRMTPAGFFPKQTLLTKEK